MRNIFLIGLLLLSTHLQLDGMQQHSEENSGSQPPPYQATIPPRIFYAYHTAENALVYLDAACVNVYMNTPTQVGQQQGTILIVLPTCHLQYVLKEDGYYSYHYTTPNGVSISLTRADPAYDITLP